MFFDKNDKEITKNILNEIEKIIEQDTNNAELFILKGNLLSDLEQLNEAEESYSKAIFIEPSADNYITRGLFYEKNNLTELAGTDYQNAINTDEYNSWGHLFLGNILRKTDRYNMAIKSYQTAICLGNTYSAYLGLAKTETELRKYDGALYYINTAISFNPENAVCYFQRGLLFLEMPVKKPKKNTKLSLHKEFSLYKQINKISKTQTKKAIKDFKKVISLDETFIPAYFLLMKAYCNLQMYSNAINIFKKFTDKIPADAIFDFENMDINSCCKIVKLLCRINQTENAVDICSEYIEHHQNAAEIYLLRGEVFYNTENYADAAINFNTALDLGCDNESLYLNLGKINIQYENYNKSLAYLNIAAEKDSVEENDKIYYYRGIAKMHLQKFEEAIDDFDIAISINFQNPDYYSLKADAEEALGLYKSAIKNKEIAANLDNLETNKVDKTTLFQKNIDDYFNLIDLFNSSDAVL